MDCALLFYCKRNNRRKKKALGSASFSQEKQYEKHRFERGEHERSYAGREKRSGAYKVSDLKFLFSIIIIKLLENLCVL